MQQREGSLFVIRYIYEIGPKEIKIEKKKYKQANTHTHLSLLNAFDCDDNSYTRISPFQIL